MQQRLTKHSWKQKGRFRQPASLDFRHPKFRNSQIKHTHPLIRSRQIYGPNPLRFLPGSSSPVYSPFIAITVRDGVKAEVAHPEPVSQARDLSFTLVMLSATNVRALENSLNGRRWNQIMALHHCLKLVPTSGFGVIGTLQISPSFGLQEPFCAFKVTSQCPK